MHLTLQVALQLALQLALQRVVVVGRGRQVMQARLIRVGLRKLQVWGDSLQLGVVCGVKERQFRDRVMLLTTSVSEHTHGHV